MELASQLGWPNRGTPVSDLVSKKKYSIWRRFGGQSNCYASMGTRIHIPATQVRFGPGDLHLQFQRRGQRQADLGGHRPVNDTKTVIVRFSERLVSKFKVGK